MRVSVSKAIKLQWEKYQNKKITRDQFNQNIKWIADKRNKKKDTEFNKNLQEIFDII